MAARSAKRFQKTKASKRAKLRQKALERESRKKSLTPSVLIVCEGSVTEHSYLKFIRNSGRHKNVKFHVLEKGTKSHPATVAEEAFKRVSRTGKSDDGGYDKLFCVIDRDSHSGFDDACNRIRGLAVECGEGYLQYGSELILSVPCFEFWLLLHFLQTTKPYERTESKSPCDNVIADLRKFPEFQDYDRKTKGLTKAQCDILSEKHETALTNTEYTLAESKKSGNPNPSTNMHILLKYLDGSLRPEEIKPKKSAKK